MQIVTLLRLEIKILEMNILHNKIHLLALLVAIISGILAPLSAQITLPNSHFQFTLPEGKWKYLETIDVDANTHVYLYSSLPVVSKDNDTSLPFIRIYVKNNIGQKNSFDFAMDRFMQQPFMIVDEFSSSSFLPCKDAMGYVGVYKDDNAQRSKFLMLYFVHKSTLVEFRLETTEESYPQKKTEFENILETITLN